MFSAKSNMDENPANFNAESEVRHRHAVPSEAKSAAPLEKRTAEQWAGGDATPSRSQAPSEDEDDDPDKVESRCVHAELIANFIPTFRLNDLHKSLPQASDNLGSESVDSALSSLSPRWAYTVACVSIRTV